MKRALLASLIAAAVALPAPATAQPLFDHLQCYKVKDKAKFTADVRLTALKARFGMEQCSVKGKGKLLCVPVDKLVSNFTDKTGSIAQMTVDGKSLRFDRICYKMECPKVNLPPLPAADQFGARELSEFKPHMLCTPAVKGLPTTTTTTTTSTTTTSTTTTTLPPLCGDGVMEGVEECDDANTNAGDCCSPQCELDADGTACTDDGEPCTDDVCDGAGTCEHPANSDPCDDGLYCNGTDTCTGGTCGLHTGDPCPGPDGDSNCSESCKEATGDCTAPDGNFADCADQIYCNGADRCYEGNCNIHLGNPCPGPDFDLDCSESCNEATDTCTANDPTNSPCVDLFYCNGFDTCVNGSCSNHTGDPCDGSDGDGDCSETCDEELDRCGPDPDGSPCDDGNFCTGSDKCDAGACYDHTGDPCEGPDGDGDCSETCDENLDRCGPDPNGSACDDNVFCNGADTCSGGNCSNHTGNPCDGSDNDGDCSEMCDENADNCNGWDLNGEPCDDGLFCTGVWPAFCLNGVCDEAGDPCHGPNGDWNCSESCDENANNCAGWDPYGSPCTDEDPCTTADMCTGGDCIGTPLTDSNEPNDTKAQAAPYSEVLDTDLYPTHDIYQTLHPQADREDWFKFHITDMPAPYSVDPRADLSSIPSGSDYDLFITFECDVGSVYDDWEDYACELGSDQCHRDGLFGCCSAQYLDVDETVKLDARCPDKVSGWAYVRVSRDTGPSCDTYYLEFGDQ